MKLLFTNLLLLGSALAVPLHTLHQFPNGTWLENIALMPNSSLLVTLIGRAEIHMVHPSGLSHLVARIPEANSVLGITALSNAKYAVAAGTTTPSNSPVEGSFSVWTLGFSHGAVEVEKVADVPGIGLANGIALLNAHTLLLADSWHGNVVRLDLRTNASTSVLQHASLLPNFTNAALPLGVNGIRFHTPFLYYTNTVQNLLGRVRIDTHSGAATGPYQTIAQGEEISQPDDFAVLEDGSVVLARPLGDTIQHVGLDGRVQVLAKGGLASGGTSVVVKGKRAWMSESGLVGGVRGGGGRVVEFKL
jgi:hypothetical protein